MKIKLGLTAVFVVLYGVVFSQNKQQTLTLDLGYKHIPFDYADGAYIGLSYYLKSAPVSVSARREFVAKVALSVDGNSLEISDFKSFNRFDIRYLLRDKMRVSLGAAYITTGVKPMPEFGLKSYYYTLSPAFQYIWNEHLNFELRGDIPLGENEKLIDRGYAFPVSLALGYNF